MSRSEDSLAQEHLLVPRTAGRRTAESERIGRRRKTAVGTEVGDGDRERGHDGAAALAGEARHQRLGGGADAARRADGAARCRHAVDGQREAEVLGRPRHVAGAAVEAVRQAQVRRQQHAARVVATGVGEDIGHRCRDAEIGLVGIGVRITGLRVQTGETRALAGRRRRQQARLWPHRRARGERERSRVLGVGIGAAGQFGNERHAQRCCATGARERAGLVDVRDRELRVGGDLVLAVGLVHPLLVREHARLVGKVGRVRIRGLRVGEDRARVHGAVRIVGELRRHHEAGPVWDVRIAGARAGADPGDVDRVEDAYAARTSMNRYPLGAPALVLPASQWRVEGDARITQVRDGVGQ